MSEQIGPHAFHSLDGVEDWRVVSEGACAFYRSESFAASAAFVQAIAGVPGVEAHPPAVDVRGDGVTVRLITATEQYMGMTVQDADLARGISAVAQEHGLVADPAAVQTVLVIPGAPDTAAVMPFWRAILDYQPRPDSPDEDLVDPHDRGPAFWFEPMDQPRADGGGSIHLAVWVPYDHAEARVASALAAGGRMVRDDHAPSWWTLADAAGNEADIATVMRRD